MMLRACIAFGLLGLLIACGSDSTSESSTDPTLTGPGSADPTAAQVPQTPKTQTNPDETPPAVAAQLDEVVYVFARGPRGEQYFCTGALISRDVVLTASHCITSENSGYEVGAPRAPKSPRVSASSPARYLGGVTEDDDDPSRPDIGVLHLDEPIDLPAYAQPVDITALLSAGKSVQGLDVVRYDTEPESPLHETRPMPIQSDVDNGYPYGITTPNFSKGGDSGSGLFEVVGGKPTHRLVGIARQPEPDKNLDHFTRIDAAFLGWLARQ